MSYLLTPHLRSSQKFHREKLTKDVSGEQVFGAPIKSRALMGFKQSFSRKIGLNRGYSGVVCQARMHSMAIL